jgi:hypothetical protein
MHFSYELTRAEDRIRTLAEEAAIMRERLQALEARDDLDAQSDGPDRPDVATGS